MPRKLPHETAIQLIAFLGGLPAVVVCLFLLWFGGWAAKVQWTLSILVVSVWIGCVIALRNRIVFPMQTLTNLLAALREGDYSLRSRRARREDSLGQVMREVNALSETLLIGRREAAEATALLRAVMAEIAVAVFTFDDEGRLRLINRTGTELLGKPESELLGHGAEEVGLDQCLEGDPSRILTRQFPGRAGGRWGLRRTSFREGGRPHQLLVLADLSQPLREEERAAWQRLIRVLGHELNNSLAPIHSIADSLVTLLRRPVTQRSGDWEQDIEGGLEVIASRAEALSRFMGGYSKLARLPAPVIRDCEIEPLIRHAAAFEVRLPVTVHPGKPITLPLDSDQMSQALINLIRNGADAAFETGSGVDVGWKVEEAFVEIYVDDGGHGLTNTTNLFVPFFTTKPQGSGIGLVVSRQIIEAHAGSLVLMNRLDGKEGCRALVRLPLAEGSNGIERDRARSSGIERTPAVPILPDPSPRRRS